MKKYYLLPFMIMVFLPSFGMVDGNGKLIAEQTVVNRGTELTGMFHGPTRAQFTCSVELACDVTSAFGCELEDDACEQDLTEIIVMREGKEVCHILCDMSGGSLDIEDYLEESESGFYDIYIYNGSILSFKQTIYIE